MTWLREVAANRRRRDGAAAYASRTPQQSGDETRPRPPRPESDGSQTPRGQLLYSQASGGHRRALAHDRFDRSGGHDQAPASEPDGWDLAAAHELVGESAGDAEAPAC